MNRVVAFTGATNFRDLGGYEALGGTVIRSGHVFRSDSLHTLTVADLELFDGLGIRAIYDLRRLDERNGSPGPRSNVHLELWSPNVSDAGALRTAEDGERWLSEGYVTMIGQAGPALGRLFNRLAAAERLPAVFHCFGGKDRTGFAAAVLLSALGVDRDVVLDDYEMTDQLRGAEHIPEVVQAFVAAGIAEPAAVAMLSTCRAGMAETLTRIDTDFGGVDNYLCQCCGLAPESLDRLRRALLE